MVKLTLAATIGLVICGISAGLGAYQGILASTPEIRLSDVVASGEATIVYDCEGNEIDQYVSINSNRIQINNMDLIPEHLGQAFVALEDKRFYQNNGIDIEGIARSGWRFITTLGKANLAQTAFGVVFGETAGAMFVAVCLFFFAFSTILSWNLFGKINVIYLFGKKSAKIYAALGLVFIFLGTLMSNDLVWELTDMFNNLMVIPNAIGLFALTGLVVKALKQAKRS